MLCLLLTQHWVENNPAFFRVWILSISTSRLFVIQFCKLCSTVPGSQFIFWIIQRLSHTHTVHTHTNTAGLYYTANPAGVLSLSHSFRCSLFIFLLLSPSLESLDSEWLQVAVGTLMWGITWRTARWIKVQLSSLDHSWAKISVCACVFVWKQVSSCDGPLHALLSLFIPQIAA